MLTKPQANYLKTIPEDRLVHIKPYTEELQRVADQIISAIKAISEDIDIRLMGATGLGISGQGDLDMYMLHPKEDFNMYLDRLIELFGEPTHKHEDNVEWMFEREGVEVELYLTDPSTPSMAEQIRVFELLKNNSELKDEYEKLKSDANGKPFREYQAAKYEFYNKILA
ncbi:MAG: GrpB family protein [Candidatus Nomurabacteria bacterium]|nr:MAG: GrpB family protein [Candidatus Nomurabacteria bacterium]HRV76325.1 GrpB family protein [Candidatus Saccharimonadales bacterium]